MIWNPAVAVSPYKTQFMFEFTTAGTLRNKAGILRIKKANLRIDMTPMIDLGFLLISFFIFTTEITKPSITKLYMPVDGDSTKIPSSTSLTILLANNDKIFYYCGKLDDAIKNKKILQTSYDELTGLGNIIRQKQLELKKRNLDKQELIILIKPGKESSYKNIIGVVDEMLINDVSKYSISDMQNKEEAYLNPQIQ